MTIPPDHPRYRSLMVREMLSEMVDKGLVSQTGLISHGRGEAFDYLMGERTLPSALVAEKAAAAYLLGALRPVICVNGNAAALARMSLIDLSEQVPAKIEVNIFHRTEERMDLLISYMEETGAKVLGRNPDAKIPGLSSDRALCTKEGIFNSDVILVPIEDGDRAKALVNMKKVVISIDINPLSRTSKTATVSICDEITRAVENIIGFVQDMRGRPDEILRTIRSYDNFKVREETVKEICSYLLKEVRME